MSLSKRQEKLVDILVKNSTYITVKELAKILNISPRTIHYDLDAIERSNFMTDFEIERKPGVGIQGYWKKGLENRVLDLDLFELRFSQIFKMLVIDSERVTVKGLADYFYVSSSSITEDLKLLDKLLLKFPDVELISDQTGTRLRAGEYALQQFLLYFNNRVLEQLGPSASLLDYARNLEAFYSWEVMEAALQIENDLADYNVKISGSHYRFSIFSVIVVMVYRLSLGKHIDKKDLQITGKNIYAMNNYMLALKVLETMSSRIHFDFKHSDIYTLSLYLHSNRLESQSIGLDQDQYYRKIASNLISRMSRAIGEDLNDDHILRNGLTLHLYHMASRLENNVIIQNPLLAEIIKDFRLMYDLVWMMMDTEKDLKNMYVSEDEVGFILLHFQSALDRKERSHMIYIVCNDGFVSHDFTKNRVRKLVSPFDVIKLVSVEEVRKTDLTQIDLLISTLPLEINNHPYILVSPLITDEDIFLISQEYQKLILKSNQQDYKFKNYLNYDFFYFDMQAESKEEILDTIITDLRAKKYVDAEYEQSVWNRERKGATSLERGVAVPHGSLSYVNKTVIPVWINQKPVLWSGDEVEIVFLYSIAQKDLGLSKRIIQSLLAFIASKDFKKDVKGLSKDEVFAYLQGGKV